MIEKRTMVVAESSHKVEPILAMYDTEKNEVVCYKYASENEDKNDDVWYPKYPREKYFNTIQEAREYIANRQEYLRGKFNEVLDFIEEMDRIDTDYFEFKKEDYLGRYAKDDDQSCIRRARNEYRDEASLLTSIARSRHFNVNGETINIDEVVRVIWYKESRAVLVMRDGHKVMTNNKAEYNVVIDMFGSNRSNIVAIS